jgi:hypothetical protein
MIGSDLQGADLESRQSGNKPGDDHDPRYRRDATSASPAAVRSTTRGGHWKITQYMYQRMPEQSGGGCSGI